MSKSTARLGDVRIGKVVSFYVEQVITPKNWREFNYASFNPSVYYPENTSFDKYGNYQIVAERTEDGFVMLAPRKWGAISKPEHFLSVKNIPRIIAKFPGKFSLWFKGNILHGDKPDTHEHIYLPTTVLENSTMPSGDFFYLTVIGGDIIVNDKPPVPTSEFNVVILKCGQVLSLIPVEDVDYEIRTVPKKSFEITFTPRNPQKEIVLYQNAFGSLYLGHLHKYPSEDKMVFPMASFKEFTIDERVILRGNAPQIVRARIPEFS